MTNLALVLRLESARPCLLRHVVIMGDALTEKCGNVFYVTLFVQTILDDLNTVRAAYLTCDAGSPEANLG